MGEESWLVFFCGICSLENWGRECQGEISDLGPGAEGIKGSPCSHKVRNEQGFYIMLLILIKPFWVQSDFNCWGGTSEWHCHRAFNSDPSLNSQPQDVQTSFSSSSSSSSPASPLPHFPPAQLSVAPGALRNQICVCCHQDHTRYFISNP